MTLSATEAARRLTRVGITTRQARLVLASGWAGPSRRTPSAIRYDEAVVEELADRRTLSRAEIDQACPSGLFVARRGTSPGSPWSAQVEALEPGWPFSVFTAIWLRHLVDTRGAVPLVATVAGFVVLGAEIRGIRPDTPVRARPGEVAHRLELGPPGPWFLALAARRVACGPGRPWVVIGLPWAPASAAEQLAAGGARLTLALDLDRPHERDATHPDHG